MNATLAIALITVSPAAPLPKEPKPNPLAWSYMGVQIENVTPEGGRLQIMQPKPGTPAARAGLQAGDVLIAVGKIEPKNFDEVIRYIFELRPGTVIEVQLQRGTEIVKTKLQLGERPNSPDYRLPDFIRRVNPNLPVDDDD